MGMPGIGCGAGAWNALRAFAHGHGHSGYRLEEVDEELFEGAPARSRCRCAVALGQELGDTLLGRSSVRPANQEVMVQRS